MTATSARQAILDRVRTATHADSDAYPDLPRNYVRLGALDLPGRLALMTERLEEYGADVVECLPANLPATIARQLESSGRHTFVAPAGLPSNGSMLAFPGSWTRISVMRQLKGVKA